ncbi:phytoene desaturase family protein [Microlunatus sp. GCM10028923]|uniref:phytoene desaturase family protein n=1 Tax=Microlunatus sp. GCM10028923 TaxID=3273400 RepID=UPI003619C8AE
MYRRGHTGRVNVVGAGPNGLAAAVVLARAGISVRVFEAEDTPGGGARTEELIEPGTVHDVCSAIHPSAFASEFFCRFALTERVAFVVPDASFAQLRLGSASCVAYRDLERTASELGRSGAGWKRTFAPLVEEGRHLADLAMGDPRLALRAPGLALRLATRVGLDRVGYLRGASADLLSGVSAHSAQPLSTPSAAVTGLVLAAYGHSFGWPIPIGGSGRIVAAMVSDLESYGGEITTGFRVSCIDELPPADATVFDTSVRTMLRIGGREVPDRYGRVAARQRPGPPVFKLDLVLDGPIPWNDAAVHEAGTVHIGQGRGEVAARLQDVHRGRRPEHPFIILSQPTTYDPTRSPRGRTVVWAYAHLPKGDPGYGAGPWIRDEIERYAPGFRDLIVRSRGVGPRELEAKNENYVGGDIYSGALTPWQLAARPVLSGDPWRVANTSLYLCSSAATPGPGVHGMGGFHAASSVLRNVYRDDRIPSLEPRRSPSGFRRSP